MRILSGNLAAGTVQGAHQGSLLCLTSFSFRFHRKASFTLLSGINIREGKEDPQYRSDFQQKLAISYIPQPPENASFNSLRLHGVLPTLSIERNLFYLTSLSTSTPDQERSRAVVKSAMERCGLFLARHKLVANSIVSTLFTFY